MEEIPFARPCLSEEEVAAVTEVLLSGWITTGRETKAFEKEFSRYIGEGIAVAVSSGTAALFLALFLAEIGPGDEVIVPPLTFTATANVVEHRGATVRFADVDLETGLLDPAAARAAHTERTRALITVPLHGRAAFLEEYASFAREKNLFHLTDCAHAIETRVNGRHPVSQADMAAFSFYATKNLTTGEGGMLVVKDQDLAAKASIAALHGMDRDAYRRYEADGTPFYDVLLPGYKFNLTNIAAALGRKQLALLPKHLRRREEIWRRYNEAFADLPVTLPPEPPPGDIHARHIYALRAENRAERDRLLAELRRRGIGTAVHFRPVHLFSYYRKKYGYSAGDFPNAEAIGDTTFSLPMTPYLTDADVERVTEALRAAFGK
ncbi:MAG: DegT/DnrJ/EryC1/StrS aminotransferase family protein [Candidatus Hydrogenedentota bacterium]|nr:MAG: DegT/DnrJ/EryC1/StrS aminotransferase family protein [Candidatus Hydrogenedentota bacterium]